LLFGAMQTVHREREAGVYERATEGAKLDAQKRAAELSMKNAAYERTVVAKEREALSERREALQLQRDEAAKARGTPGLSSTWWCTTSRRRLAAATMRRGATSWPTW